MTTDRMFRMTRNASRGLSTAGVRQIIAGYQDRRFAAVEPGWTPKPGMLYTQVRAISARINQNFDAWPSEELKKSYRTFLGKPVFVNHANEDPEKARGKVIAARYVEAGDDKYIEVIQEVDAKRFPKLAREIREGGLDSVSMGVEAGITKCSYCGNTATDEPEFCEHVRHHKGEYLPRRNAKTGRNENVLVYENCYKLGFFELSYVFEPADETAVVSRVLVAGRHDSPFQDMYDQHHISEDDISHPIPELEPSSYPQEPPRMRREIGTNPKEKGRHRKQWDPDREQDPFDPRLVGASRRYAYGEIEAPEDIDTLRDEDGESFEDYQFVEPIGNGDHQEDHELEEDQDTNPFQHFLESPPELQDPDLGATKRLDREQEDEGLDSDRRVEDIEGIGSMPDEEAMMAAQQGRQAMARRNRRRRVANDDAALIDQAVQELEQYEAEQGGGDDPFGGGESYDEGNGDEGDFDGDGHSDEEDTDDNEDGYPEDEDGYDDDGDGSDEDFSDDPMGGEEVYGGEPDGDEMDPRYDDPEAQERMAQRRYLASCRQRGVRPTREGYRRFIATVGRNTSAGNMRGKGNAMGSLAGRGRVAAKGRNRHFADTGHFDGGPFGNDATQGVQEEVYISQVPPADSDELPGPGDGTISNTENTLVARKMQKRIKAKAAELQRELRAYRKLAGEGTEALDPTNPNTYGNDPMSSANVSQIAENHGLQQLGRRYEAACRQAGVRPTQEGFRRFHAAECCDDNIVEPSEVNPELSGTDDQDYKGDFDSVQPDAVPTQPKDASVHVFRSFDNWLQSTTGRTASQHGNANFIRRQAASYAKAANIPLERMFPALDSVLRQARKTEADRRAAMKRRANESLETAAPQQRIDVETPVSDITDADAQGTYDLSDYANNAGDNIADPNLDTSSQIWAPGEGTKSANRKADAVAAVRYAEAYINAGLPHRDKWQLVAQAQTMRHATVVDRTRVLEAVVESNTKRAASRKVAAAVSRGTANGLPRGLTNPRTAGTSRTAANDPSNDIGIWL